MTRSWEAFDRFRIGLDFWQRYAVQSGEQDPDALTKAIPGLPRRHRGRSQLRSGALTARARASEGPPAPRRRRGAPEQPEGEPRIRPGASRARVRALRHRKPGRGQVARPVRALGPGNAAGEERAAAHNLHRQAMATARHRQPWSSPTGSRRRCSRRREPSGSPRRSRRRLRLGAHRAASWAGLCRYAFERGGRELAADGGPRPGSDWIWPTGAGPRLLHAAYFHCQQADRFYAALLGARRRTSGSGRRARRSWPRSASCSSTMDRRISVTT